MAEETLVRVLVVEDDEDVRALVMLHLTMSGHVVSECATVDEGLQAVGDLTRKRPDVVVTDLNFGLDSGERLVRRCQELGQPVILMTASAEVGSLPREVREGVLILHKPFALDDLTRAIGTAAIGGPP